MSLTINTMLLLLLLLTLQPYVLIKKIPDNERWLPRCKILSDSVQILRSENDHGRFINHYSKVYCHRHDNGQLFSIMIINVMVVIINWTIHNIYWNYWYVFLFIIIIVMIVIIIIIIIIITIIIIILIIQKHLSSFHLSYICISLF